MAHIFLLLLPLIPSLVDVGDVLACRSGESEVLVFDLGDVAKALAQLQHLLGVLILDLVTSQEATMQFVQTTAATELMLVRCLRLLLDSGIFAFVLLGAAALPLNMTVASFFLSVSSVAGGCYESSCDTLSQPLILTACCRIVVRKHPMEAVRHHVVDAYYLSVAFTELRELLQL